MVLAKSKYLLTLCLHSAAPSGFYSGHAFLGSQETINIWTKKNKSDSFISIAGLSNPVMFITLDMFLLEKILTFTFGKCTIPCKMKGGLNKRVITPLILTLET